jgi:putative membrane protein insertion efficiency factor
MGHCDSSTQLSRHSAVFSAASGAVETDASRCQRAGVEATDPRPSLASAAKTITFGAWWLLAFVQFYKIFFSPFLGGACKFYPSCSNYAQEAIELHGARRGSWLALKRLGRCRPFTKGGFDPLPDAEDSDAAWLRSDAPFDGAVQSKERAQ